VRKRLHGKIVALALFDLLVWFLYFVICSAPSGSAFIYVDF
jgi:hypothetical protein